MNIVLLSSEPLDIQMYVAIMNPTLSEKYIDFGIYGIEDTPKMEVYKFYDDDRNLFVEHEIYIVRSKCMKITACRYFRANDVNKLLNILKCYKRIN